MPAYAITQKLFPKGNLLRTWELKGGISARMTAFEFILADGSRKKVIARYPNPPKQAQESNLAVKEFSFLEQADALGLPVQKPFFLEPSEESPTYFVLEYVEGSPLFSTDNLNDFIEQFARNLAAIHKVKPSSSMHPLLAKEEDYLAALMKRPSRALDDSLREADIRNALEQASPLPKTNEKALLHGDYWPGNLLWKRGRLEAIIDWEDAMLGEPLIDVSISRLDLLWLFGTEATTLFTNLYRFENDSLDWSALPYYDLLAALRPASRLSEWASAYPCLGRPDVTADSMRQRHHQFVEKAFAKLG